MRRGRPGSGIFVAGMVMVLVWVVVIFVATVAASAQQSGREAFCDEVGGVAELVMRAHQEGHSDDTIKAVVIRSAGAVNPDIAVKYLDMVDIASRVSVRDTPAGRIEASRAFGEVYWLLCMGVLE